MANEKAGHHAVYKATIDHRIIADKLHLSIYAEDTNGLKSLLELRNIIKEKTNSTCIIADSDEVGPHLAGLFIRFT